MPEEKLNGAKLREHLRRCWALYLAGIALLCFLNHLVYTVSRPGFSEEETLRVMLLNVELDLDEEARGELLRTVQAAGAGIRTLEVESLVAARTEDAYSGVLLTSKLIAGYGDVYVTDVEGFALLAARGACLALGDLVLPGFEAVTGSDPETGAEDVYGMRTRRARTGTEIYLAVMANGTNLESTLAALPALAAVFAEG